VVQLSELTYKPIGDGTNGEWILSQPEPNAFGTFSSSDSVARPSLDITSVFGAELISGQRGFLYRWSPTTNAPNGAFAKYTCGSATLNVTYVTP
jgi:hypothetical protein